MSDADDWPASRRLEWLARLQRIAADFAQREEALLRDLSVRRSLINRTQREALEKLETHVAARTRDADAARQSHHQRLTALYAGRRTRVQRAAAAALRKLPRRARQTRERWMGDLQLRQFQGERKLESDQKAADAALEEFNARLAATRARLRALRRRVARSFAGYLSFQKLLRRAPHTPPVPEDGEESLAEAERQWADAEAQHQGFRRHLLPRIFSFAPSYVLFPLLVAAVALGAVFSTSTTLLASAALALAAVLHHLGWRQSRMDATASAAALQSALDQLDATAAAAAGRHQQARSAAQADYEESRAAILEQWESAPQVEVDFERTGRNKIETQLPRIVAKIDEFLGPKLQQLAAAHASGHAKFHGGAEKRRQEISSTHAAEVAALAAEEAARWKTLIAEWQREITPLYAALAEMTAAARATFPPWSGEFLQAWAPAATFTPATPFARLAAEVAARPRDPRLALPGPAQVSLPLTLSFPREGSLLFETAESADATIVATLNNIILRLLTTTPPGKVAFTIIDPVGLGQSFAGLMHLADHEEALINRRIWTQRDQIDERTAELSEHLEKVIQMYLRNEYATISEYNEQAGSVAEKYHFLVVADFPGNFSESAARRLQSIAISGARCGVFTLLHCDTRQQLPDGFSLDELRASSIVVRRAGRGFALAGAPPEAAGTLTFEAPPRDELAVQFVHKIGRANIDSNRVEVPFAQIEPAPAERWTHGTTNELRIAIGRTGATRLQYLAIGKGTRQHALFAGKTGSGKSTLFHVIITNLALACAPEEVEFYLIDFKKGVEFKCYAEKRLPHARVVAIESDREFGLSVLQRVDEELKRRGDLFRGLGVQDLPGYKRAGALAKPNGGLEPMPRSLLIIDEFQEFFVEDDAIAQTASLLFDRIVRQGRAFGIHVLLGSQTLGGAYSLARATLGQMVIRVALQCNEADAYLIMDENNSAPRLLSRPGEGIYNDAAGALEGNSPFQVVWLGDDERDARLEEIRELAQQRESQPPSPIVFEGNAPADLAGNDLLGALLRGERPMGLPTGSARVWLGAPNSIKGPTEAVFHRQSGSHLLIVGQRDEAALTMLGIALLSLAAQHRVGEAKFIVLHSTAPGSPDAEALERLLAVIPHEKVVSHGAELPQIMAGLAAELAARSAGDAPAAPATFIVIHGLHRFKKLRQEDDFSFSTSSEEAGGNPGAQLAEIITEGSSHGLHLLVSIDTFNNVNRSMSRKALSEFEMRVVFQMSANDSASLIDSPKASTLGLHRALFYNEQAGTLETFRPYAAPDRAWLAAVSLERFK